MYIRFVILKKDHESHSKQGIFQAAFELRDSGKLSLHEHDWIERELAWLRKHLKSPACLRAEENHRGISWFQPRAKKPIERVRSIAALLKEHGMLVEMVKTKDPGIVIYEDGWQVVAKPRRRGAKHGTPHRANEK